MERTGRDSYGMQILVVSRILTFSGLPFSSRTEFVGFAVVLVLLCVIGWCVLCGMGGEFSVWWLFLTFYFGMGVLRCDAVLCLWCSMVE